MTLRRLFSFLLICGFFGNSYSQIAHNCGTDQAVKEHMKENPNFAVEQEKLESFTKTYISSNAKQGAVYIIPVVFHVDSRFGSLYNNNIFY